MMYRVAESLADQVGAEGIVTGEKIGEEASQTLWNLRALGRAIKKYPIHRPLVGLGKAEIEGLARNIGTYETIIQNVHGCESIPHKPVVKAKVEEIEEAEVELNTNEMTNRCVGELKIVDL
jgi:thiamine biosynthesis protein ThiI